MSQGDSTEEKVAPPAPAREDPDVLLTQLGSMPDLGVTSDEIFLAMTSPWRKSVLSSRRSVLLAGVSLEPGDAVVEIGPAAGALTRWLLERGIEVVAVCGSELEEELTLARCSRLGGLTIHDGPLDAIEREGGFAAVIATGPYSASLPTPVSVEQVVAAADGLLADDGVLVVCVDNAVGLDRICAVVDGDGRQFLGLDHEPSEGSRHHRASLDALIGATGLTVEWSGCYPHHHRPSAVVSADAYRLPDAVDFIDQVVRRPVDLGPGSALLADTRTAHRQFVGAGIGLEVAPSLVAIARRAAVAPDGVLVRSVGAERLRRWARDTVVAEEESGRVVRRRRIVSDDAVLTRAWLSQDDIDAEYLIGPNLEQVLVAALDAGDVATFEHWLFRWHEVVTATAMSVSDDAGSNPFLPAGSTAALPPTYLDIVPDNFSVQGDDLILIDEEWSVDGGVDAQLAIARALTRFAIGLVSSGVRLPWAATATPWEIARTMASRLGVVVDEATGVRWCAAEAELLSLVYGVDPVPARSALETEIAAGRLQLGVARSLPFGVLVRSLAHTQSMLAVQVANTDEVRDTLNSELFATREQLTASTAVATEQAYRIEASERVFASLRDDIDEIHHLRRQNHDLAQRLALIESRLPVRIYRRLTRYSPGFALARIEANARALRSRLRS